MVILLSNTEMKSRFLNMPDSLRVGLLIASQLNTFFHHGKFLALDTGVIHHNL